MNPFITRSRSYVKYLKRNGMTDLHRLLERIAEKDGLIGRKSNE